MFPKLAFFIIPDIRGMDSIDEFMTIMMRIIKGKITITIDNMMEIVSNFK